MDEPYIWMPIRGYLGFYAVSEDGRVLSLRNGKTLKWGYANGYPMVFLCVHGGKRKMYVHQAVASAFIGPRPAGQQVRHKDGNRSNPHASNLEYGTPSQNEYDKVRHGTHQKASRKECARGHEYTDSSSYWNGRQRICRICRRENVAAWRQRNPEALREQRRDYKQRLKLRKPT